MLVSSNKKEQCWIWENQGDNYYYDKHEWVRVRVEQEKWHDASAILPKKDTDTTYAQQCRYSIVASMTQSALGIVTWW